MKLLHDCTLGNFTTYTLDVLNNKRKGILAIKQIDNMRTDEYMLIKLKDLLAQINHTRQKIDVHQPFADLC